MGRAEGLIALGVSLQLLVLAILGSVPSPPTNTWWVSLLGFVLVILGAWMTAWQKQLAA